MKVKIYLIFFLVFLSACQSKSFQKIVAQHYKTNIAKNNLKIDFIIKRYEPLSNDTFVFYVTAYKKYVNDTFSQYIIETPKTLRNYKNGDSVYSEALYYKDTNISIYENNYEIYFNKIRVDTIYKSFKKFESYPFSNFPLWINLLNEKTIDNFSFDKKNKIWIDTFDNYSAIFEDHIPIFFENKMVGTVGLLTNQFYLNSFQIISDAEFDERMTYNKSKINVNIINKNTTLVSNDSFLDKKMPSINLIQYNTKKNLKLEKNPDKLLILDFSYVRCAPCVRAIPVLDSIKNNFEEKVQIYTIDPLDKFPKDSALLAFFYDKFQFENSLYLTDLSSIDVDHFNVNAFPTIFIIDKVGKIVFVQQGFTDDLYDKVASAILQYY